MNSPTRRLLAVAFLIGMLGANTGATDYAALHLYQRVEYADTIVVARIIENSQAAVERVLKGRPPRVITLVRYHDGFASPSDQRPLVTGARELMFLQTADDGYAPLQSQYGRWLLEGQTLTVGLPRPRNVNDVARSIASLVALQARAMGSAAEADRAYVTALKSRDPHVRLWAHFTGYQRVETPSEELSDTFLDLWRRRDREAMGSAVNAVITWRLRKAGPLMRDALTDPGSDDEVRCAAARGLGGSGDLTFLPLLRQTATAHPVPIVRANAYEGLGHLLGPESLADLAIGAKDDSDLVRRYVAVHAYNVAQRAHRADVTAQVRQLLETLRDESPGAAERARYMLAMLAKLAP